MFKSLLCFNIHSLNKKRQYIYYIVLISHVIHSIRHTFMHNKVVADLVMGRVGYGPSLYGPSWLWAEFVMGRVCYGPRCPVTIMTSIN